MFGRHTVAVHWKHKHKDLIRIPCANLFNEKMIWFIYLTTYVRRSLTVCDKLKRPESRLPSAKRICKEVVGCDESKFNFSFALKSGKNIIKSMALIWWPSTQTYSFSFSSFWVALCGAEPIDVAPSLTVGVGLQKLNTNHVIFTCIFLKYFVAFHVTSTHLPRVWPFPENGFILEGLKSSCRWSSILTGTILPDCRNSGGNSLLTEFQMYNIIESFHSSGFVLYLPFCNIF